MISIMEDITKFSFLKTLWYLRDYLSDIVIGGGWAPLIYYHYLLGDKPRTLSEHLILT